ncbi:MAG: PilZ domain-containing protein [Pirellulaceae bacterium]|nr:PilZ domain-containing protein [Planctomycetales bacterium]MCA9264297.1 PilZ domain-containing protein [Planctomycetales bacterium]
MPTSTPVCPESLKIARRLIGAARGVEFEQRSSGREPLFLPIQLSSTEPLDPQLEAYTRDVSEDGIGLLTNRPLDGMTVTVTMEVSGRRRTDTLQFRVHVNWSMPSGDGWYISGGAFLPMS